MNELPNTFHLSITGLRVRPGFGKQLRFRYHAVRSFMQARKAPGVLHVAACRINGVEHTVTAWRDREAMLAYVRSGAHREAMRAFHRIATGATCSFTTDRIPDWPEVHTRWKMEGVVVGAGERQPPV
jgi:quinol monooxygenase YgiN